MVYLRLIDSPAVALVTSFCNRLGLTARRAPAAAFDTALNIMAVGVNRADQRNTHRLRRCRANIRNCAQITFLSGLRSSVKLAGSNGL